MSSVGPFRVLVVDRDPAVHIELTSILCAPAESTIRQERFPAHGDEEPDDPANGLPKFEIKSVFEAAEAVDQVWLAEQNKSMFSMAFVAADEDDREESFKVMRSLWQIHPDLTCVLYSDHFPFSWSELVADLGATESCLLFQKPFDPISLCQLATSIGLQRQTRMFVADRQRELLVEKTRELEKEIELRKQIETNLRNSRDSMQVKAETDAGTGLLNRGAIMKQLETVVQKSKVTNEWYSLVFIDIDHFKSINDTFGHLAGDIILSEVAKTLALTLRPGDQLGRFGGEEFVVILPGCEINDAYMVGERLRAMVARKEFKANDETIPVTVSLGIVSPADLQNADVSELLERADQAMYRAKQGGRNRVETEHISSSSLLPSVSSIAVCIPDMSPGG